MILSYSLTEHDFLQHQLFVFSRNKRAKKQRIEAWLTSTVALLFLSLLFHQSNNELMAIYFLTLGLAFFAFFPTYRKWHNTNYLLKYVAETFNYRFGKITTIEFSDTIFETRDVTGESKIYLTIIENTIETKNYFYLKIKTGEHLIIPKSKLTNLDYVRAYLIDLCNKLSIQFINDQNSN